MNFLLTIIFQVFWNVVLSQKTSNIFYESIQSLIADNERIAEINKIENISEVYITSTHAMAKTNPDVQHLSDVNGTSVVSSHYMQEHTTLNPTKKMEVLASISNISHLALQNFKGTISKSFLKKFNEHWLKFPPPNPTVHYVLAVVYFVMALFGLSGNFLVIFMFIKCSTVRTPANNLILNLAISDFIIMLEAPIFIYNSLYFGPATGEIGCKLYGLLGGLGGTLAIVTLTVIAIDRYNVIVFPLDPSRSTTNNRSRIMILLIWVYSVPFAALPVLEIWGVHGYIPEGFLTACSFDYLNTSSSNFWFIFAYAIAAFFMPLIVISYCYFHILHVVLSAQKIQSSKEKNKTELRLAAIVMGIIGLWIFAWAPYCVVALFGIFGFKDNISPLASMVPAIMAKTAACIDPYLYAVTHPRFRNELKKMMCSARQNSHSNFNTSCHSRGASRKRGRYNESECESIEIGVCGNGDNSNGVNGKERPQLKRAESSFGEDSYVSEAV